MPYNPKFMEIAAVEAESNVGTTIGGPFGSVIVKAGLVISKGHNQVLERHDPTAHGEIVAIREACKRIGTHDLSGYELYTNAYPCPMCMSAIIWSNIKTVYYGNTAQDAEQIGFRDDYIYNFMKMDCDNNEILSLEQHDRAVTIKSFEAFNASQDKQLY